jgi:hypothetical protein
MAMQWLALPDDGAYAIGSRHANDWTVESGGDTTDAQLAYRPTV